MQRLGDSWNVNWLMSPWAYLLLDLLRCMQFFVVLPRGRISILAHKKSRQFHPPWKRSFIPALVLKCQFSVPKCQGLRLGGWEHASSSRSKQFYRQENESLIHSHLSQCSLDGGWLWTLEHHRDSMSSATHRGGLLEWPLGSWGQSVCTTK